MASRRLSAFKFATFAIQKNIATRFFYYFCNNPIKNFISEKYFKILTWQIFIFVDKPCWTMHDKSFYSCKKKSVGKRSFFANVSCVSRKRFLFMLLLVWTYIFANATFESMNKRKLDDGRSIMLSVHAQQNIYRSFVYFFY